MGQKMDAEAKRGNFSKLSYFQMRKAGLTRLVFKGNGLTGLMKD